MSYDISVGNMNRNMTSNCNKMWDKAMPTLNLRDMDGLKAFVCIPYLKAGVEDMFRNRQDYLPLEPDNGWGDYGAALSMLGEMLLECEANPNDTVRVHT